MIRFRLLSGSPQCPSSPASDRRRSTIHVTILTAGNGPGSVQYESVFRVSRYAIVVADGLLANILIPVAMSWHRRIFQ